MLKIISGMHRSGTSLVARLFFEAGADFGDPKNFYRPDRWNPDGYFEQPDIQEINMPLINGRLWKFAYFLLPSTEKIIDRAEKFSQLIDSVSRKYHGKFIKETRFCLTLPAWLKYGAEVEGIVVCLRDPLHVAMSLHKRNKISIKRAYCLWHLHNQRLLENSLDIQKWFVYYGNLLDKERCLDEIMSAFSFFGFDVSRDKTDEICSSIINQKMNNSGDVKSDYPEDVRQLWQKLMKMHDAQTT